MAAFWEQKKKKRKAIPWTECTLTSPFSMRSTMLPNSVMSSESDIVNIPINRSGCTKGVYKRLREDSLLLRTVYQPSPSAAQGCGPVSPDTHSMRQEQEEESRNFCAVCHMNSTLCATGLCPERWSIRWHWSLAPSEGNMNKPLASSLKHETRPTLTTSGRGLFHAAEPLLCAQVYLATATVVEIGQLYAK